ncbi:MAG: glutamate racemase [Pseudomonadota bacterium]
MDRSPLPDDKIGVFDSGVGGLSVLRALHARLSQAQLHYVADSAYAPYGDRSAEEVIERSMRLTRYLLGAGARMIVVACNTATTAAIRALRAQWPRMPFVGVEPGIKPAVARSPGGRIGVMATQRTIDSERLRALVQDHASGRTVVLQACPGLADAIEAGDANPDRIDSLLRQYCLPLQQAHVDTVVLGCTHYPFVADRIRSIMGSKVLLIDTADAVAQRAQSLWPAATSGQAEGSLLLQTTGDPSTLMELARRWLPAEAVVERVSL